MVHWTLKEKFDQQDVKFQHIRDRYDKTVIAAGTHLADVKAEQEAILRREFQTGDDLSGEKSKIREKITDAEQALMAAEMERAKANEYVRAASGEDRITTRALILDWNGAYRNNVRDIELKPILERAQAARDAYYNAVLDYHELVAEYSYQYEEVRELAYGDRTDGYYMSAHKVATEADFVAITNADLILIGEQKKLPDGVKRTVNGGESK